VSLTAFPAARRQACPLENRVSGHFNGAQMLEKLVGLEKMNILQCQEMAKDVGFDSTTFDLCGPKGRLKAKWVEAYFGFFELEGREGVLMATQFQYSQDIWCENVMPANAQVNRPQKAATGGKDE